MMHMVIVIESKYGKCHREAMLMIHLVPLRKLVR